MLYLEDYLESELYFHRELDLSSNSPPKLIDVPSNSIELPVLPVLPVVYKQNDLVKNFLSFHLFSLEINFVVV